MNTIHTQCPFSPPEFHFVGYRLTEDFKYVPSPDGSMEYHVSHYHIENPDHAIARERIMHELQVTKALMELGSNDPCYRYQYQGLSLEAIYEILYPAGDRKDEWGDELPQYRKIRLLNGEPTTEQDFLKRLQMEYDLMGETGCMVERCEMEGGLCSEP